MLPPEQVLSVSAKQPRPYVQGRRQIRVADVRSLVRPAPIAGQPVLEDLVEMDPGPVRFLNWIARRPADEGDVGDLVTPVPRDIDDDDSVAYMTEPRGANVPGTAWKPSVPRNPNGPARIASVPSFHGISQTINRHRGNVPLDDGSCAQG